MAATHQRKTFGTFGTYRFALASMVVATHTAPKIYATAGIYAVFAFFVLSGYVMSYILNNYYFRLPNGLRLYAINRFLRIFPPYWVVFIGSLAIIAAFPTEAVDVYPHMRWPRDIRDWLWNITTLSMSDPITGAFNEHAVVPVSWSLGIEILFWTLIPTFLRDPARLRRWLILASIYTVLVSGVSIAASHFLQTIQFTSVFAAALPFGIGMFLLRRKLENTKALPDYGAWLALGVFAALIWLAPYLQDILYTPGFLAALAANVVLIERLGRIDQSQLHPMLMRADRFLGKLSYPIYLVHLPVAVLLHTGIPDMPLHSLSFCILTLISSSLVALLLHIAVEGPIELLQKHRTPHHQPLV